MSSLQTPTSRRVDEAREQLNESVRWTTQRGRLLASLSVALLCIAAFIGGLFIVALKDIVFDLPGSIRLALLVALLLGSLVICIVFAIRPWLNARFKRAAGEQIDHAAQDKQQPVTVGLSLGEPMDDDSLALMLLQRAETRAAEVAQMIKPKQAYPLRRLRRPGSWLALAMGFWLLLAIIVPSQVFALIARVMLPWGDTPPFSLTQLEPAWTPKPPDAGDDVELTVEPTGLMPDTVDWVRLDQQGNEAERFSMTSDGQGGFNLVLRRVESPIDFRLEAHGRHTRTFTITPTPRPQVAEQAGDGTDEQTTGPDGSTTFDPEKIAQRDLDANDDWQGIKAKLLNLLDALEDAQAQAEGLDPADAAALQALADRLAELAADAKLIAGELDALQGDLPAEAAALLDALAAALSDMKSAALPAPPGEGAAGSGEPTLADWLKQAADAAQADQQQIGQGLGPSDQPTDSGTTSGTGGVGPDIRDPSTSGSYDATNPSGTDGPLPDAVMQQVPPTYRAFVSTYFDRLAKDQDKPKP